MLCEKSPCPWGVEHEASMAEMRIVAMVDRVCVFIENSIRVGTIE